MHEAMLYKKLPDSRVECHTCQWRCAIAPGKLGVCRMYQNHDGTLYSRNYAQASSVCVDPIEKKPLFHFFPGSSVFSVGGWGCNFHCQDCQNWQISCPQDDEPWQDSKDLPPRTAIEMAKQNGCRGIAWTYNEPTVWLEYTLDSAKLAKENGLYTVYVTNGYITAEALDAIGPYLDAWALDIKGFTDKLYHDLAGIPHWRGILEVAKRAKEKWDIHTEVITNIIPTMNDDNDQLESIARWVRQEMGEMTPWHVTRFHPYYKLDNLPPTPISTLERAYEIGKNAGLKFVYTGNVPGHDGESTRCCSCGKPVIKRLGYQVNQVGLRGSQCRSCGAELNIRNNGGEAL